MFDYLTFATLLWMLHAGQSEFRTGWFTESVLSASVIVLVLPYTPVGRLFHFVPLPAVFLAVIGVLLVLYVGSAEVAKHFFYRIEGLDRA